MKGKLTQILATLIITIAVALGSFATVWPSYSLKLLGSQESPVGYRITSEDGNRIGSVLMLGALLSTFPATYISENIGRKRTFMLSGFSIMTGWALIATAKTATQILIGRFANGVGMGLQIVTTVVYISEISEPSIRGALSSFLSFMYNMGGLVSYVEGWVCSYDAINYSTLSIAVFFLVMLSFLKDTPSYLMGKGMEKQAIESLKFYRGKSELTQEIMDEINYLRDQRKNNNKINANELENSDVNCENQKLNQINENLDETPEQSTWSILRSSKSAQRALVTLSTLMCMTVSMGMMGVQAYAGQFFSMAAPNLSPDLCSVLLALVVSIMSGVSVITTDLLSRRTLMMSTCALSGVCLGVLASLLRWAWAPEWAVPLIILLYCVCYHLGAVNIVFVQTAESFAPQIKSFATSVIMCSMFISNFVVLYLFGPCVQALGLDGAFFMFSGLSLLTAFVVFLLMKETRRVPFEVIHSMYEQGYLYRKHELYK